MPDRRDTPQVEMESSSSAPAPSAPTPDLAPQAGIVAPAKAGKQTLMLRERQPKTRSLLRQNRLEIPQQVVADLRAYLKDPPDDASPRIKRHAQVVLAVSTKMPLKDVVDIFGLSRPQIWRILRTAQESGAKGITTPKKRSGRPTRSAEVIQFITSQGRTLAEAAEEFSLTLRSVQRHVKKAEASRAITRPLPLHSTEPEQLALVAS